jgi:hypothetical protein
MKGMGFMGPKSPNALGEYIQRENQELISANTICSGMVVSDVRNFQADLAKCLNPDR